MLRSAQQLRSTSQRLEREVGDFGISADMLAEDLSDMGRVHVRGVDDGWPFERRLWRAGRDVRPACDAELSACLLHRRRRDAQHGRGLGKR